SLRIAYQRADSAARASGPTAANAYAVYVAHAAEAHGALATGDTARATSLFSTLPDSLSLGFFVAERVAGAHLLEAQGRADQALAFLDRVPPAAQYGTTEVRWTYERARLAAKLGHTADAMRGYTFVANAWAQPDSALGEMANAARRARASLVRR